MGNTKTKTAKKVNSFAESPSPRYISAQEKEALDRVRNLAKAIKTTIREKIED